MRALDLLLDNVEFLARDLQRLKKLLFGDFASAYVPFISRLVHALCFDVFRPDKAPALNLLARRGGVLWSAYWRRGLIIPTHRGRTSNRVNRSDWRRRSGSYHLIVGD